MLAAFRSTYSYSPTLPLLPSQTLFTIIIIALRHLLFTTAPAIYLLSSRPGGPFILLPQQLLNVLLLLLFRYQLRYYSHKSNFIFALQGSSNINTISINTTILIVVTMGLIDVDDTVLLSLPFSTCRALLSITVNANRATRNSPNCSELWS